MAFQAEFGVQLHLPTAGVRYTTPALIDLGVEAADVGFRQVWVTDNLRVRNIFVVLAGLAMRVPVKLGAAVLVQYFRNPVDVADAVASISELMEGREFTLGIGRGNLHHTPHQLALTKPLAMSKELAESVRALLAGERVRFAAYPALASYFNLNPEEEIQLIFRPRGPVPLLNGGNGPKGAALAARSFDGMIYGPTFVAAAQMGKVAGLLDVARKAAEALPERKTLRFVAEINVFLSSDRARAREAAKTHAASMLLSVRNMGHSPDDFRRLGVTPEQLDAIGGAAARRARPDEIAALVTDEVIDATYIAGDLDSCRPRLLEICRTADALGFHQIMFSKLGPDFGEAIRILAAAVL
jgi:alkanesulfonate monooxygenase SsuD/methylene tetrahydromethanopterin reductase-like flavin-dependent oxidoreductase (luciferase family)